MFDSNMIMFLYFVLISILYESIKLSINQSTLSDAIGDWGGVQRSGIREDTPKIWNQGKLRYQIRYQETGIKKPTPFRNQLAKKIRNQEGQHKFESGIKSESGIPQSLYQTDPPHPLTIRESILLFPVLSFYLVRASFFIVAGHLWKIVFL